MSTPAYKLLSSSFNDLPIPKPSTFSLQWWLNCLPTFFPCKTSSLLAVRTKPRGLLEAVRAPMPYYYFFKAEQIGIR